MTITCNTEGLVFKQSFAIDGVATLAQTPGTDTTATEFQDAFGQQEAVKDSQS